MNHDTIFLLPECTADSDMGRLWACDVAVECECWCETPDYLNRGRDCDECDVCKRRGKHAPTEYRRMDAVLATAKEPT